ncbi:MAG: hypothetical protein AAF591_16585 [Verrucomicrobiota bacterium]
MEQIQRIIHIFGAVAAIDRSHHLTFLAKNAQETKRRTDAIPPKLQDIGFSDVDAGWIKNFVVARLRDGTTRLWGNHLDGGEDGSGPIWPAPDPTSLNDIIDIAATDRRVATVTASGELYSWGEKGTVRIREIHSPVVAVEEAAVGLRARTSDGSVYHLPWNNNRPRLVSSDSASISKLLVQSRDTLEWHWIEADKPHIEAAANEVLPHVTGLAPGHFAMSIHSKDNDPNNQERVPSIIWIEPAIPSP